MYNYNGDSMNKDNIIVSIKSIKDIEKITADTKYINIAIDNVDEEVINYFYLYGQEFYYSDMIKDRRGYTYIDYDNFKASEDKIQSILKEVTSLEDNLEKTRYLYIALGKIISLDINLMEDKNDSISFGETSIINNIWGAMKDGKVTDNSCAKLFMYLCSRVKIKSEFVSTNISGHIANRVYLDDSTFLIVDLFNDIHNIKANFMTEHFDNYNDNISVDKKIGYIRDNYANCYLEAILKKFGEVKGDILYKILSTTEKVIELNKFIPIEIGSIFKEIFRKYYSNYDIKVNNLYINNENDKNHFVIISYKDEVYSFNYCKKRFVLIDMQDLRNNIKNNIIGIYDNEKFKLVENEVSV